MDILLIDLDSSRWPLAVTGGGNIGKVHQIKPAQLAFSVDYNNIVILTYLLTWSWLRACVLKILRQDFQKLEHEQERQTHRHNPTEHITTPLSLQSSTLLAWDRRRLQDSVA